MPGRRPLVAFVALFAVPLPACLHISAPATPITTPDEAAKITAQSARATQKPPRMEFAVLPRAPGTVVPTKPAANPTPPANTVTQKPTNSTPASAKPVPPVRTITGVAPEPFPVTQFHPSPEAPLLAAVRAYTEGRPDRAIEIIRTLNTPNQDLVLALMPILARGATTDLNNDPATVAALVEQLQTAAHRLEPRAALRVEKIALCDDVKGFGRFVPHPDNSPYRPNAQVQLYLEVGNLGSRPAGNEFVTRIHAAVEVWDSYGKLVGQVDRHDYKRRVPVVRFEKELPSQSPLHDFHVLYIFSAPPAPGVYTITVELSDPTTHRAVKTPPVRFDVAGP